MNCITSWQPFNLFFLYFVSNFVKAILGVKLIYLYFSKLNKNSKKTKEAQNRTFSNETARYVQYTIFSARQAPTSNLLMAFTGNVNFWVKLVVTNPLRDP
jgi:hypothetical protein